MCRPGNTEIHMCIEFHALYGVQPEAMFCHGNTEIHMCIEFHALYGVHRKSACGNVLSWKCSNTHAYPVVDPGLKKWGFNYYLNRAVEPCACA